MQLCKCLTKNILNAVKILVAERVTEKHFNHQSYRPKSLCETLKGLQIYGRIL